jgi:hypothetical protein
MRTYRFAALQDPEPADWIVDVSATVGAARAVRYEVVSSGAESVDEARAHLAQSALVIGALEVDNG